MSYSIASKTLRGILLATLETIAHYVYSEATHPASTKSIKSELYTIFHQPIAAEKFKQECYIVISCEILWMKRIPRRQPKLFESEKNSALVFLFLFEAKRRSARVTCMYLPLRRYILSCFVLIKLEYIQVHVI